ncbi:hypothetical protein GCM10017687_77590 [Streptomyces echinatus]
MEASELTAWVMTLLTQASNGAAGAIGGAAGAEASRLVRERLGSSSEGRAALDPENGDPDEAARQVTAVLNADPGFAGRLERLHEAAQRQPSAAPYAGRDIYQASVGERAKNNTIAFGPLTLRKDRAPITVTALLLVVALVLGFAVYGLVQALSGDSRFRGSWHGVRRADRGHGQRRIGRPVDGERSGRGEKAAGRTHLSEIFSLPRPSCPICAACRPGGPWRRRRRLRQ